MFDIVKLTNTRKFSILKLELALKGGEVSLKQYLPVVVALVVVGALNWGLVGLLGLNLVSTLLGSGSILERAVYVVVGLAGLLLAWDNWGSKLK